MEKLREKIESKRALVGVVGLGYVGLPLAVAFANVGFRITGIDRSKSKVATINAGKSDVEDVASSAVAALVDSKNVTATNTYTAIQKLDVVVICVPTPLSKTKDPDVSYILSAVNGIKKHLRHGHLIILESTTYPGTTEELILPILEATGLKAGQDFFLAFSPERVDPGREDWTTENTPKVIGGITSACTQVAAALYGQAIKSIVPVSSTEVAEMAKLLENTFRAVNIAMVNEMAVMCQRLGIDVWEVIEAAASKPFGFMKFTPGPGLGGHCIPIDPLYLSWKLKSVKYNARFIELASEINTNMPRYVVGRVVDVMNDRQLALKGSRMLIMGVAYKPDVADVRESPALDVIGLLQEKGAQVEYYDPYVPSIEHDDWDLDSVSDPYKAARRADCVVVITDHAAIDYQALAKASSLIFDSRNAFGAAGIDDSKIERL